MVQVYVALTESSKMGSSLSIHIVYDIQLGKLMGAPLRRCQWPQQMMHNTPYGNHTDPICGWLDVNARGGHLQGGIVFLDVLAKRYGGKGEACTRGRTRSEQVSQWSRKKNGEEGLTIARSAFNTAKVYVSPGSLITLNHSSALLALRCPTPYVKHRNTSLIKFWKGDIGCCVQILLTPHLTTSCCCSLPLAARALSLTTVGSSRTTLTWPCGTSATSMLKSAAPSRLWNTFTSMFTRVTIVLWQWCSRKLGLCGYNTSSGCRWGRWKQCACRPGWSPKLPRWAVC